MAATDTLIATDNQPVFNTIPAGSASPEQIEQLLAQVTDPEIPVLSIVDLGVLRAVQQHGEQIVITITPTYSGCPAMQTFADDILSLLRRHGIQNAVIETRLAPAWTTDWLSQAGREKLRAYGIAPPVKTSTRKRSLWGEDPNVQCPQCQSRDTRQISRYGSTACKALYQCNDCLEPFDYFKCL